MTECSRNIQGAFYIEKGEFTESRRNSIPFFLGVFPVFNSVCFPQIGHIHGIFIEFLLDIYVIFTGSLIPFLFFKSKILIYSGKRSDTYQTENGILFINPWKTFPELFRKFSDSCDIS